jgi:hypothetical protein
MHDLVIMPLIALLFALAAPVWASESGCTGVTPSAGVPSGEGQIAYVDPETGELLSEPPAGEQLEPPVQPPVSGEIRQEVLPDGSVVAYLGDRFMTTLRVEIVDGKVVTCHRSAVEAQPPGTAADSQVEKTFDDGL